ncbi:MAG: prepilin-type N-terminal cleavage/methylation domain-containing protein [Opitutaceae bacterium]
MKNNSKKGFTLVEIMIVVVIIGLLAAMAIPAFQKVRTSSQEKAVLNNLRQLASGADQYFLEEGEITVATVDLVGTSPDAYVKSFGSAAGETYPADIAASQTSISVTTAAGDVISIQF